MPEESKAIKKAYKAMNDKRKENISFKPIPHHSQSAPLVERNRKRKKKEHVVVRPIQHNNYPHTLSDSTIVSARIPTVAHINPDYRQQSLGKTPNSIFNIKTAIGRTQAEAVDTTMLNRAIVYDRQIPYPISPFQTIPRDDRLTITGPVSGVSQKTFREAITNAKEAVDSILVKQRNNEKLTSLIHMPIEGIFERTNKAGVVSLNNLYDTSYRISEELTKHTKQYGRMMSYGGHKNQYYQTMLF
jgi:hypothetical protein